MQQPPEQKLSNQITTALLLPIPNYKATDTNFGTVLTEFKTLTFICQHFSKLVCMCFSGAAFIILRSGLNDIMVATFRRRPECRSGVYFPLKRPRGYAHEFEGCFRIDFAGFK